MSVDTKTDYRLAVGGMDCADYAKTIEASLAAMPGVHTATVSFGRGTADVSYDPGKTDTEALAGRVQALGYSVTTDAPAKDAQAAWQFDVAGMDCSDCAKTIETGLRRLPEIGDVQVSFGSGILTVTPAGEQLTEDAVVSAVAQAGFDSCLGPAR